jgi:transposase
MAATLIPRTRKALAPRASSVSTCPRVSFVDAALREKSAARIRRQIHGVPTADVVFDKFHVLQHASAALDEVRRQEFFRAGAVMRAHGRGKRWLLLRRWKTVRGSKRRELQQLFAVNRRLFKAYVLREQLDRLWTYKTPVGVGHLLFAWVESRSIPGPSARVLKSVKTVKNSVKNVAPYASVCLSEVSENGMMMKQCFATPNSPRRR